MKLINSIQLILLLISLENAYGRFPEKYNCLLQTNDSISVIIDIDNTSTDELFEIKQFFIDILGNKARFIKARFTKTEVDIWLTGKSKWHPIAIEKKPNNIDRTLTFEMYRRASPDLEQDIIAVTRLFPLDGESWLTTLRNSIIIIDYIKELKNANSPNGKRFCNQRNN